MAIALIALAQVKASDLNPKLVGSYYFTDSQAWDIAVSGTHAYLTDLAAGLQILDISNPAEPTRLGSYNTPGSAWGVAVSGKYAYVADEATGLLVIDVSDPTSPRRVGGYNTSGSAYDVFLSGSYAYVADGQAGLVVIDVSNPASPRRVGGLGTPGEVHGVVVSGNYAYLADRFWNETVTQEFGALRIVDISNPASPRLVSQYQTRGQAWNLAVSGSFAYVGADELEVIDVSDPANPQRVGSPGPGGGVALSGNLALVANFQVGLQVFDISNPVSPRRVGGYQTSGYARNVAVAGNYAYVAANFYSSAASAGLQIIELETPANLPRVGSLDTPGYARDVAISGTRAYVADATAGMQILDITDPRKPVLLGSYATTDLAELVAVNGNLACVVETWQISPAVYGRALHVVDVSDPALPRQVGVYTTSGYFPYNMFITSDTLAVSVTGDYAFLALGNSDGGSSGRIEVIDLRTPADPKCVAVYDTSSLRTGFAIHDRHLLVADGLQGLVVLDVSDAVNPQSVGSYPSPSLIYTVALSGTRAYVIGTAGLQILDLTDPSQPQLLGGSTNFGESWHALWRGLAASGNYIYCATAGSGVQVVDISDPTNPRLVGGNSAVLASDLEISGNYLFVAGGTEGLQVFDLALTHALPLLPLPALRVIRSGDALLITWPASVSGAVLETTDTLSPTASWVPVAAAPVAIGDETAVAVDIEGGMKFYRLRKL